MKSIIDEALTRGEEEQKAMAAAAQPPVAPIAAPQSDKELEEVLSQLRTEIAVIGCGGSGSNTITRMMEEGIHGARLIAMNTDAQHLIRTQAQYRILLGRQRTRGLGAGSIPQVGEEATVEALEEIKKPNTTVDLPYEWPDFEYWKTAWQPSEPSPITKYLREQARLRAEARREQESQS